jgi:hypothetical protein
VLFLLFGASAAGKTSALDELQGRVEDLAIHDFDELGVPPGAGRRWRHRSNEAWLRRALVYQAQGTDILLAGQTPLGELLATPSAPLLEGVAACLLDCDDETRSGRLQARGPGDVGDHLNWAAWMRGHAVDPGWRPEVIITDDGLPELEWTRWSGWSKGDPRWRVHVIDTTTLPVAEVAAELVEWIETERALARAAR